MIHGILNPAGYLGLFAFMVLTGCGLPLPEEVAIVTGGILSAQGKLNPQGAFAALLLGALIGDVIMYSIGYKFGHSLLSMHPRMARLLGAERGEEFERAISRHGFKVLLISRFMVGVRGPVYLTAGVVRMPFRMFVLCDLVSATLVVGLFFAVSYYFGRDIAHWLRDAEVLLTVVILTVVGVVAFVALRRYREQLMQQVIKSVEEAPTTQEKKEELASRSES